MTDRPTHEVDQEADEIDRGRVCNLCFDADRLKGSRYCAACFGVVA